MIAAPMPEHGANHESARWRQAGPRKEPRQRLRALVGDARAAVLEALAAPHTTGELAVELGIAPSTASERLTALARAGLIDRRRAGREVYYVLNSRGMELLALFGIE
jgi:DNA-binding transcriptional ArsR family regulator